MGIKRFAKFGGNSESTQKDVVAARNPKPLLADIHFKPKNKA